MCKQTPASSKTSFQLMLNLWSYHDLCSLDHFIQVVFTRHKGPVGRIRKSIKLFVAKWTQHLSGTNLLFDCTDDAFHLFPDTQWVFAGQRVPSITCWLPWFIEMDWSSMLFKILSLFLLLWFYNFPCLSLVFPPLLTDLVQQSLFCLQFYLSYVTWFHTT